MQISFKLSGILNLPFEEKQRLFETHDLVERIILLNKLCERFEGLSNPVLMFELDENPHKSLMNVKSSIIFILVFIIIAIILKFFPDVFKNTKTIFY